MTHSTHWQDLAADYDDLMASEPTMQALRMTILEEIPPAPRAVLDLGTGTGSLLTLLRDCYPESYLWGLDLAPAMLEEARERMKGDRRVVLVQGSAHQINTSNATFDAVVSNFALHHLTHSQKQDCAHEVFRVLVPGGRFVYGDQHCRQMGTPEDPEWIEDIFDLFCSKARYYLRTSGLERMLLQVTLLPRFIRADGEIPATVDYWQECLARAGFIAAKVISVEPEFLCHSVIVAVKPGGLPYEHQQTLLARGHHWGGHCHPHWHRARRLR